MKRKLLTLALGIAAMFTGCQKEDSAGLTNPDNGKATFHVAVDNGVQTRATTPAPTRYIMEVYEVATSGAAVSGTPQQRYEAASGSFEVILKEGTHYACLFWADYGAPGENAGDYDASDLKAVSARGQATDMAFGGAVRFTYDSQASEKSYLSPVLTHSVAQVNFKQTEDFTAADNTLTVEFPKMFSLNLDGNAVTEIISPPVTHTFTGIAKASQSQTIGTSYIIAADADQTVMDIKTTFNGEVGKTITNVPFQRNYKTNITGAYSNLYETTLSVTCDDAWETTEEVTFPKVDEMKFTIDLSTFSGNTSYTLPFTTSGATGDYTLTVDWGDGSSATTIPAKTSLTSLNSDLTTLLTHTYTAQQQYTITIATSETDITKAQMPGFMPNSYRTENDNKLKIKSMDSPMLNTAVSNFSYCFGDCTGLTKIPAELFDKNTAAISFGGCFSGCTGLTAIPAGLFGKNTNVNDFGACFRNCTGLTAIPAELFDNNTVVKYFNNSFEGCTGLTEIPAGLFANNTVVTNFSYCFSGCTKLVLNENIFCNEATDRDACFADKKMNFSYCFQNCGTDLQSGQGGTAPALWNYAMDASSTKTRCFSGVTNVTNADDIPTTWGGTQAP